MASNETYHVPPGWDTWAERFHKQAHKYSDEQARAMRELIIEMQETLSRRLRIVAASGGQLDFGTINNLIGQIAEFEGVLATRLNNLSGSRFHDAIRNSIDAIKQELDDLGVTIPIKEMERLIFDTPAAKLFLEQSQQTAQQFAGMVGQDLRQTLALHLGLGSDLMDTVQALTSLQGWPHKAYWQGERVVRTEYAYAYNMTTKNAMDDVAQKEPDIWLVWYEHAEGPIWGGPKNLPYPGPATPLDKRVADDSLRLHGQARRPGQLFCDPLHPQDCYPHPPNRPNDRATIVMARIEDNELILPKGAKK